MERYKALETASKLLKIGDNKNNIVFSFNQFPFKQLEIV